METDITQDSSDAIAIEAEMVSLMTEAGELEITLGELFTDLDGLKNARLVIEASVTQEQSQRFAFESIIDEEDSVWKKIVDTIKKWIEKIKELWGKFIQWLKSCSYETESDRYYKHRGLCAVGIEHATAGDTVTIKNYVIDNPMETVVSDILAINSSLDAFYELAKKTVTDFLNPSPTVRKSFWEKLKEKFKGAPPAQAHVSEVIRAEWEKLEVQIGIKGMEGSFTSQNVKHMISLKYFKNGDKKEKKEVPVKDFAKTIQIIDSFLEQSKIKELEKMCTVIRNGSTELQKLLHDIEKYKMQDLSKEQDAELMKDIAMGKNGSIIIIRNTLSICNAIGQLYWGIFLMIREDVKKCVSTYCKIAKKRKKS